MSESSRPRLGDPVNALGRTADVVLALVFCGLIVCEIWVLGDHDIGVGRKVVATTIAPAIAGPLAFRSVKPFEAFLFNSAATVAMITVGFTGEFYQWPNLVILFTVAVMLRGAQSLLALGVSLASVAFYFVNFRSEGLVTAVMVLGLWLVVWLVGRVYGQQIEEHRLRGERDLVTELAATRQARLDLESQRTTMARELHDLIGHTVNVMVVHAGAGRGAVRDDPETAEQALETIETTGRAALEELDRVLGVLRNEDAGAPLTPLPSIGSLQALVEEFSGAGLPTSLEVTGAPAAVPAGVGLTVYRVVQEALTNTMKHAEANTAAVSVAVEADEVEVTVVDDGRGRDAALVRNSGAGSNGSHEPIGRGLVGISERVQLQGGEVGFGPAVPDRGGARPGFRVACTVPFKAGTGS